MSINVGDLIQSTYTSLGQLEWGRKKFTRRRYGALISRKISERIKKANLLFYLWQTSWQEKSDYRLIAFEFSRTKPEGGIFSALIESRFENPPHSSLSSIPIFFFSYKEPIYIEYIYTYYSASLLYIFNHFSLIGLEALGCTCGGGLVSFIFSKHIIKFDAVHRSRRIEIT